MHGCYLRWLYLRLVVLLKGVAAYNDNGVGVRDPHVPGQVERVCHGCQLGVGGVSVLT